MARPKNLRTSIYLSPARLDKLGVPLEEVTRAIYALIDGKPEGVCLSPCNYPDLAAVKRFPSTATNASYVHCADFRGQPMRPCYKP
jgi:hypothetical protein